MQTDLNFNQNQGRIKNHALIAWLFVDKSVTKIKIGLGETFKRPSSLIKCIKEKYQKDNDISFF